MCDCNITSGVITLSSRSKRLPLYRVLVAAHVVPGPAVEAPLFHVRDVIRHQVVRPVPSTAPVDRGRESSPVFGMRG